MMRRKMNLNETLYNIYCWDLNYHDYIGLEFECETENQCNGWQSNYWLCKNDHSLRNGLEWCFKTPLDLEHTINAINNWFTNTVENNNSPINNSPRTSIHVHRSCMDMTLLQVYTFLTVYYIIEPLLVAYCGKTREGNLFCLRMMDADYSIGALINGIENRSHFNNTKSDDFKYAALNLQAISKYGSLEFRMRKGDYTKSSPIIKWVKMTDHLVRATLEQPNPLKITNLYKSCSKQGFLRLFLPSQFVDTLMALFPNYGQMMDDAYHYVHHLATAHPNEWVEDKPPKKKKLLSPYLKYPTTPIPTPLWFNIPESEPTLFNSEEDDDIPL